MKKAAQYGALGLVSSLLLSSIALASTGTISDTGPNSDNNITQNNNQNSNQENNNNVEVDNNSNQNCESGNANTSGNTSAGGAQSGNATCENTTSTIINIANGGEIVTPGKGAGPVEAVEAAAVTTASVSAPTSLPRAGVNGNWLALSTIGSLAVVALKLSLEVMVKNTEISY